MGSVNTQSQACSHGERLSALVDGEMFDGPDHGQFLAELDRADRAAWAHYHLIGDALRSDELALSPALSAAFTARMSAALAAEPHLLAPAAAPVTRKLLSLRRRVVPAFAVAAAAATLTWIVVPQMQTAGTPGAVQVASVGAPTNGGLQRVTVAQASAQPGLQDVNIIRDASLDQYLEAHQQFAQQPVVTGSMPLIRAAVSTTPGQ
ncbi:TPA: sigma-E factor negative regulatory protein [Burkholderia multivorans]|uniref:sigma-E factor negative regulatory protein n=1 Tax=Burkholderia multivorans TaxID=87883 RepID=UPI000D00E1F3|nr:sigma-E factor negative regulatory protein [Burkholderia multivorans]MBU9298178.1 sigma-E factor negative regulatory protein [Burkholderia multivorans]MBU9303874.1 sigma-E factor negative regulatory protein [Burkholderia multivorans]MBU9406179.1 sigma-E factor negative regulatory protein [Burkholderia multivorans]MBU9501660.1 sigma-E factor negative regulatory protein [Burkholderia multivorans]MBU9507774.1 sigma-E factor negative regulatory protein [Burkholderia multivorans]